MIQCTLTSVGEKHDGSNKADPKLDGFAVVEREIAKAKGVPLNPVRRLSGVQIGLRWLRDALAQGSLPLLKLA